MEIPKKPLKPPDSFGYGGGWLFQRKPAKRKSRTHNDVWGNLRFAATNRGTFRRRRVKKKNKQILILGVGNILFTDEGLGVRVVEKLMDEYEFSDNVVVEDGGVLGLNLLGVMTETDHLIVVDTIQWGDAPGTFHRMKGEQIPQRIRPKNSLHQVDFLEAYTCCQLLDNVPETVILGLEPLDIETLSTELTSTIQDNIEGLIQQVLMELDHLGAEYRHKGESRHVPGGTCQDYKD
jgi:hydrogenase maturation protease